MGQKNKIINKSNNKRIMKKAIFYGKASRGQFVMDYKDKEIKKKFLLTYEKDTPLVMEIKKYSKLRTSGRPDEETNFNGYYWGVIVKMVADEMGELDQEYTHGVIQVGAGNCKPDKKGNQIPLGTSNMSGGEFAEYCSKARMWASQELGLYIPEPYEGLH